MLQSKLTLELPNSSRSERRGRRRGREERKERSARRGRREGRHSRFRSEEEQPKDTYANYGDYSAPSPSAAASPTGDTETPLEWLETLTSALGGAGVSNAISLTVNGNTVYMDMNERMHDIQEMLREARNSRKLQRDFSQMYVIFSHEEAGLRHH